MVKIIYLSDTHFRSRRPIRRIDVEFFDNQLKKLDELVDICIKNKVQALIHGGDLFDVALPDYGLFNAVAKRFRKLHRAKVDCYITYGSHDLLGYQIESVNKTGIGALIHTGLLKELIGPTEVHKVMFYGVPAVMHHTVDLYKDVPENYIIITHNIVTSDIVNFEHLTFENLASGKANRIFLCAHYHKYFKTQVKNAYFFNTGPLIRGDKNDAEHTPNVLLMELAKDTTTFTSFFLSHVKNAIDTSDKIELGSIAVSGLQNTQLQFVDIFELTKKIAAENNISTDILNVALSKLEEAQRSLSHD